MLGLKISSDDVINFFTNFVKDTVDYREKNGVDGKDFIGLMIHLKNHPDSTKRLTFNQICAQSLMFFLAGFESTSTTLAFCLYEMALHQNFQDSARWEIIKVLEKHKGTLTYEAVMEMKYLEQVLLGN